ncbi:MAG: pyridoxal-phosphate dependent enzyme [Polyangiaceae bacterium]
MSAPPHPILAFAPGLARRPRIELTDRPTAIEQLPAFGSRVWVKREDRVSSVYGGNKVRRWEWLLGEARARGATEVMTVGGLGSSQVTSVAVHAGAAGFKVSAVLFDQLESAFVSEALELDARAGAAVSAVGGIARAVLSTTRRLGRHRGDPSLYFIAPGASGPVANVAYVDCALEIGEQVAAGIAPRPDRVVVACGSGGTAVGLSIGFAMLGWPTVVTAVRITDLVASNALTLGAMAFATTRLLRREGFTGRRLRPRFEIDHRFIGRGYGYATPEAERGARRFAELFGVAGEVTYSGKALAALEVAVTEHPGETILWINTLSTTGRLATLRS